MQDTGTYSTQDSIYADGHDDWRLFEGVRTRRVFAFLIDYAMVFLLIVVAVPLIFLLGFATFGAAWLLYLILTPLVALTYIGWTMGGPAQATIGMRLMDIRLERYDGRRIDFVTSVVHSVLFWASAAVFAPLLLAPLVVSDKRTLHDLLLGTVVVRASR